MSSSRSALQRQNEATALITSGHVWKAVWYLAWPTAINTTIMAAYTLINRLFLSHLRNAEPSLAASGIGGNTLMLQFAIVIGLSAGTSALVSRSMGARDAKGAEQAARQSFVLAILAGAVTGLPLMLYARPLIGLVCAKPALVPLAAVYASIISLSSIPMFVNMTALSILRSQGDARSPLYSGMAVVSVNVLLDWLLIFGFWQVPAMGIRGAAVATVVSRVVGMTISLALLRRSMLGGSLTRWRIDVTWLGRILGIGWPASMQSLLMTTSSLGFMWVLSLLPARDATTAIAAYSAALAIEAIAFQPGIAFSTAATPLVGQNLGAGKPERAVHSAWVATGQAAAIMGLVGAMFVVMPQYLARPFGHRKLALVTVIASYLRINSFSEPFLALNMVLRGALQGAGETRFPAIVTFATMWLVRLPLAWLLAIHLRMGADGAWWAMSLTCCLSGALMALWFRFGNWRETRV